MTQEEFEKRFTINLNEQQKTAVYSTEGQVLLLAVPGSGKTTVLITRLGYMIYCKKIDPRLILTMTYTVSATNEMKQRFTKMFGEQYSNNLEFRTINGVSAKIIDYYSRNYARESSFTLLDNEGEISHILREIYKETNEDFPTDSIIKEIRTAITYIKNMMITEIDKIDTEIKNLAEIYNRYIEIMKRKRLMDYDDQMRYAHAILKQQPRVLKYFHEKYKYICVDESQDTSKIQHEIIKLLAHGNVFMVGDEDQSIYGFRAAYPKALMDFKKDYKDAKVLLMEKNYRSTKEIIAVANAFVVRNKHRYEKEIKESCGSGSHVGIIKTSDRASQYKFILGIAKNIKEETAILYRNNDSALPLIDMFEREKIPYTCRKFEDAFFSNRIVLDITDMINFAHNPNDTATFMRIYYKFGQMLNRSTADYVCSQSRSSGKNIPDVLMNYSKELAININLNIQQIINGNAMQALGCIWNGFGYKKYVERCGLDDGKYFVLSMIAQTQKNSQDFLNRISDLREILKTSKKRKSNIILSTVHSSKGLEYDNVYLLDIIDGVIPPKLKLEDKNSDEIYEEERRIYYVGMTRAKFMLNLFDIADKPSAFTNEVKQSLPTELIDESEILSPFKENLCGKTYTHKVKGKGFVTAQYEEKFLIQFSNQDYMLMNVGEMFENKTLKYEEKKKEVKKTAPKKFTVKVGDELMHRFFGKGKIISISSDIAEIRFEKKGETKLLGLTMCLGNGILKKLY